MNYPIRINKYIREKGLASRREADQLISAGKVLVNGKPAEMGMLINEGDEVALGQERQKTYAYLAYYKPRGLATQAPAGSESVITDWQEKGLFPIGRLDKESEGLLILTNDGRLTTKLTGPKSQVEKEYLVSVQEALKEGVPAIFERGMQTKTFGKLLPAKARLISKHTIRIVLREGKRHQIRVMLGELGYTVTGLKRIRIGDITIGNLRPGQTRKLSYVKL